MTEFVLKQLNLELSSVCSYSCVGCPNTFMKRPKGHMSLSMYKAILEDVGDSLERVYLWNYGEPLLNPRAMRMLELLREYRVAGILSTTGFMFQKDQDWSPLTALDELIVSINGLDEETYGYHQHGGHLADVLSGLPKIRELMAESNTRYVLQFVAHRKNLHQLPQLLDFAAKFGFKQVCVKTFSVMDGLESTFRDFVPDGPDLSRYGQSVRSAAQRSDPCRHWLTVNSNGDVLPCCFDYQSEVVLGNASSGIGALWASTRVQEHLRAIEQGAYYRFCDACTKRSIAYRKNV